MTTDMIIYRKRFFPQECIRLDNDNLLYANDELLLTSWKTIRPRKDLASGFSAYLPKEGFKISKFLNASGELLYWYCDIISTEPHPDGGLVFVDLLIDIVVHKDGSVRLLDVGEAGEMLNKGIISPALVADCLQKTDRLLHVIYAGHFPELCELINLAELGNLPPADWHYTLF